MSTLSAARQGDRTSWAKRNPTLPTQRLSDPKRKLDAVQKARRKISAEQTKRHRGALNAAILKYLEERAERLDAIAAAHNVKVAKVVKLVNSGTHYAKSRAPSLKNAIVHFMSKKINEGLALGNRKSLAELQEMALTDPDVQNLTKEEEEDLIEQLKEHRREQKMNARPNNKSAARDVAATIDNTASELEWLASRTGYNTILLGVRGSVNDEAGPQFNAAGDAEDFFPEVLGKDPWEVARLFEQWCCKREKNLRERDTLAKMRTETSGIVRNGLRLITNVKKAEMNYANYDAAIVQAYGVELINWPLEKFASPSTVTTVGEMRKLRDALKCGECKWKQLTSAELKAHADGIKKRQTEGQVVGKPRKKRSDAGVPRNKRQRDDAGGDKENEGPQSKKRKTSASQGKKSTKVRKAPAKKTNGKAPTSNEYVDSDTDDSEDGEGAGSGSDSDD